MPDSKYVSVSEYAKLTGKDVGNIRRMIIASRLPAIKIGNQWLIEVNTPYPADKRFKSNKC